MITLEELARRRAERDWLLPPEVAVPQFPAVALDAVAAAALRHGRTVGTPQPGPAGTVRLHDEHGRFFGLGERDAGGRLKVRRLFASQT
jgi:tRNA pseudouridine55 synthase